MAVAPAMSTRLVLVDADGEPVMIRDRRLGLDLTGVHNADSRTPVMVMVERECDMGHWHAIGSGPLPLYDVEHDPPAGP